MENNTIGCLGTGLLLCAAGINPTSPFFAYIFALRSSDCPQTSFSYAPVWIKLMFKHTGACVQEK